MAYTNSYNRNAKTDRFGNSYKLISLAQVVTKTGDTLPIYSGIVEIGGKQYKIEVSNSNKTATRRGQEVDKKWCKITNQKKITPTTF